VLAAALRLADEQGWTRPPCTQSPDARTSRRWRCTGTGTTGKALPDALAEQLLTAYSLLAAGGRRDEPLVALAGIKDNA